MQNHDLTWQFFNLTQPKSSSNSEFRHVFASKCRKIVEKITLSTFKHYLVPTKQTLKSHLSKSILAPSRFFLQNTAELIYIFFYSISVVQVSISFSTNWVGEQNLIKAINHQSRFIGLFAQTILATCFWNKLALLLWQSI